MSLIASEDRTPTLVGDLLFPPADYRRTTFSLLQWWETRRLPFNLIVGGTGLFTLTFLRFLEFLPPGVHVGPIGWAPIAAYGVAANICYSFGWGIEVVLKRLLGDRAPYIGPALFRQGLAFSVGLTLLPIIIGSASWVVKVGLWLVGARAV